MTTLRLLTAALGLFFAAAALAPVAASAQDARLEAAKKEGKVVWYTSLALSSSGTPA